MRALVIPELRSDAIAAVGRFFDAYVLPEARPGPNGSLKWPYHFEFILNWGVKMSPPWYSAYANAAIAQAAAVMFRLTAEPRYKEIAIKAARFIGEPLESGGAEYPRVWFPPSGRVCLSGCSQRSNSRWRDHHPDLSLQRRSADWRPRYVAHFHAPGDEPRHAVAILHEPRWVVAFLNICRGDAAQLFLDRLGGAAGACAADQGSAVQRSGGPLAPAHSCTAMPGKRVLRVATNQETAAHGRKPWLSALPLPAVA